MKTKGFIIAIFLLFNAVNSFSQKDLFEKFSDNNNITTVFISKALLNLMPGMSSNTQMNGVNIDGIVNKLEQIDIYTSKDKEAMQLMRAVAKEFQAKTKAVEILMKIKSEENNVIFYGEKEGSLIKSLVMFADNKDECVLIRLLGQFTMDDIKTVIEK